MIDLETKKEILLRLRRIEGQLRGLQRMVKEEATCSEILTQVAAVSSATKRVGTAIIQGFMEDCLSRAGTAGVAKEKGSFKEFHRALSRYIDWA